MLAKVITRGGVFMDNKEIVYKALKAQAGKEVHIRDIEIATGLKRREIQDCIMLLFPKVGAGKKRDCYYAK